MRTLLILFISLQIWQAQGNSKPTSRPGGPDLHLKMPFDGRRAAKWAYMYRQNLPWVTTTTKVWLKNDCDYVNYYCLSGYKTGKLCGKTIYNTYDTFDSYCDVDYMNCIEGYEMWGIAHMGECYKVSGFETFSYYAYGIWDDGQLEELYVAPIT